MFTTLMEIIKEPARSNHGVSTDNSIILIYPPEKELDFREQLLDEFVPTVEARAIRLKIVDAAKYLFSGIKAEELEVLMEEEFEDYKWMKQGLSKRVEKTLVSNITELDQRIAGGNILLFNTAALYPLIRFNEILKDLRQLDCRLIVAFPGEDRGGKLHFMNQPDGGNYLTVKIFWQ